ncbi:hypothetical protein ABVT39_012538 [Epinephelus coioides]
MTSYPTSVPKYRTLRRRCCCCLPAECRRAFSAKTHRSKLFVSGFFSTQIIRFEYLEYRRERKERDASLP